VASSSTSTSTAAAAADAWWSSSTAVQGKIRVVIVGFGTTGLELLTLLRKNARFLVVLIEPRDAVFCAVQIDREKNGV
jgi:NADPH-dependent glutamate synthase beta subunit-like oxidoreductase